MLIICNKWRYQCIVSTTSLSFCSLLGVEKCGSPQYLLFSGSSLELLGTLAEFWEGRVTYKSSIMADFVILQSYFVCLLRSCSQAHDSRGHGLFAYGKWGVSTILCYSVLQLLLAWRVMHSCSLNRKPERSCLKFLSNGCGNPLRKQKGSWATTNYIYSFFNISWTLTQHLEVGKGAQNKVK